MTKKFTVKSLGCKTNRIETDIIIDKMLKQGYEYVSDIMQADIYILNSCAVTHSAESKSISAIHGVKSRKPNIITVLTGCHSQLNSETLKNDTKIDYLVGNAEKTDIPDILQAENKICVSDIFAQNEFKFEFCERSSRSRAIVKIQDGCDNRCSYCTIPFARGKNRSAEMKDIITQIEALANKGYDEVVLTGIHLGQWGKDHKEKQSLIELLKEIEKTKIRQYRLGSLNPTELNNDLLNFLASSTKFCPHFHLSLQSVCDKTLKNMNRHYCSNDIKSLVETINNLFKHPFLGSDIIVGFPNETNEDFETTINNVKELKLSQIHVFPYSLRRGTVAATMSNHVAEATKKERAKILQEISDKKLLEFLSSNLGLETTVIIEAKKDSKTGFLKGVTPNYINILIDEKDVPSHAFQNIRLIKLSDDNKKIIAKII